MTLPDIRHGDCLAVMAEILDNSIDSVVCDPPYGLEFMGKDWDAPWKTGNGFRRTNNAADIGRDNVFGRQSKRGPEYFAGRGFQEWCEKWATECLRVLKPGGHLLAFGGARTFHRLAVAIEDAGFDIRDSIAWLYSQGFPKSQSVHKSTLKRLEECYGSARCDCVDAGNGRSGGDSLGRQGGITDRTPRGPSEVPANPPRDSDDQSGTRVDSGRDQPRRITSDSERGRQPAIARVCSWCGLPDVDWLRSLEPLGTALKPAMEPIVVARKPLKGTVAANVQEYGTGALNIDACRVGDEVRVNPPGSTNPRVAMGDGWRSDAEPRATTGRWPTNVALDGDVADALDEQTGISASARTVRKRAGTSVGNGETLNRYAINVDNVGGYDDAGGASRFFPVFRYQAKAPKKERPVIDGIAHPTVKPLELMRWLVKLVTPPQGVVLDPFAGTGTTGEAAYLEGFDSILIEREAAYLDLIRGRMSKHSESKE